MPSTPTKKDQKSIKESRESFCQTSPGLLKSLIRDINAEIEEAKR